MKRNRSQSGFRNEDGFLLLGVLFMILVIMIMLAIAAPKMADSIRRDKEEETIHRGKQYARAIQMYYNKFGRYPNTIDQLMKANNQRFLRKRYLDPMTGKDDWRIIHNGEQKVPTTGLFGQVVQQNGITPTGATTGDWYRDRGLFGSSSPFGSPGVRGFAGQRRFVSGLFLRIGVWQQRLVVWLRIVHFPVRLKLQFAFRQQRLVSLRRLAVQTPVRGVGSVRPVESGEPRRPALQKRPVRTISVACKQPGVAAGVLAPREQRWVGHRSWVSGCSTREHRSRFTGSKLITTSGNLFSIPIRALWRRRGLGAPMAPRPAWG